MISTENFVWMKPHNLNQMDNLNTFFRHKYVFTDSLGVIGGDKVSNHWLNGDKILVSTM